MPVSPAGALRALRRPPELLLEIPRARPEKPEKARPYSSGAPEPPRIGPLLLLAVDRSRDRGQQEDRAEYKLEPEHDPEQQLITYSACHRRFPTLASSARK